MIRLIDHEHLAVGDQTWWGEYHETDYSEEGFEWKDRQFLVRFESKWSASIIWGYCTYSDNHDLPIRGEFTETPTTVEVGIFHADRDRLQPDGDPFGYLDAEQVNALLTHIEALHTGDHFNTDRIGDAASRRPDPPGADQSDRV